MNACLSRTAIFSSIDVNEARATVGADKSRILANIASSPGGVEDLNATLKLLFLLDPIDVADDLGLLQQSGVGQNFDWTYVVARKDLSTDHENYRPVFQPNDLF